MDSSKFLILGANGQLGRALQARYPDATALDRSQLDITDQSVLEAFDWSAVSVILNAAAYTKVDQAETSEGREAAWQINAVAVGNLARIANQHNLTLVHISSEYLFDGTKSPHSESEHLTPLGVYAQTKAAGDIAASTAAKYYNLRTSWVVGDGPNFVRTMISLAERNISPSVVADQIGRLTFTDTLVDAIDHLLIHSAAYGTYNISNDGEPGSWAEVTRLIFQALGRNDLSVTDTTTVEYFASKPESAPRPLQSTFDLTKIKATGLELRDWRQELMTYVQHEQHKEG